MDLPKLERPKKFSERYKKMELVESIFTQLHADIQSRLKLLERQMIAIIANANRDPEFSKEVKEDVQRIKDAMKAVQERVNKLETNKPPPPATPITSAGLEGMLVRPLTLPSPILASTPSNSNSIIMPMRNLVINEVEDENAEPDEEAMAGEMAEQMGGIDAESEQNEEEEEQQGENESDNQDDEEQQDEEQQDEEENNEDADNDEEQEVETVELSEFIWKGKTYGKSPDHMVYRLNEEGDPEDEPFARFDPATNRLLRI